MPGLTLISIAIHALGAAVWVGGMFFAYLVLRPSMGSLEPPQRLSLWSAVFSRFFLWVWISVIALAVSGYVLIFNHFGGFSALGMHINIMHAVGLVMIGLFVFLYFVPYRHFINAVTKKDWPLAAAYLNTMRRVVGTNTILGLITVIIGASGRFWS